MDSMEIKDMEDKEGSETELLTFRVPKSSIWLLDELAETYSVNRGEVLLTLIDRFAKIDGMRGNIMVLTIALMAALGVALTKGLTTENQECFSGELTSEDMKHLEDLKKIMHNAEGIVRFLRQLAECFGMTLNIGQSRDGICRLAARLNDCKGSDIVTEIANHFRAEHLSMMEFSLN